MDDKKLYCEARCAELKDGDVVNLGIGLPTLVADYVPEDVKVVLQAELEFSGPVRRRRREKKIRILLTPEATLIMVQPGAVLWTAQRRSQSSGRTCRRDGAGRAAGG